MLARFWTHAEQYHRPLTDGRIKELDQYPDRVKRGVPLQPLRIFRREVRRGLTDAEEGVLCGQGEFVVSASLFVARGERNLEATVGFKSTTYDGFAIRLPADVTSADANTSESPDENLASCLALPARKWPDLAAVVDAWPRVPEAIRAGLVAMVQAADTAGKP